MVQGEVNTAMSPAIANQVGPSNPNGRLYENVNNNNNVVAAAAAAANNDNSSEKKKKVGNYIISKTIGEGSFAKVRLGYHLITQQMVAVKVINKREVLKRNYLRANLRREACMMQRMQHPHIIQLFEVMETENCYYIVMELIDGIEFVKYLSKKRSLDENETRSYIRQICSAVDHMHRAKVVHRDIKLQNFMLDQSHNLTIIDFGLSNSLDDREFLNTQCGSPAYAAPEIFAHQDYGPEVDIWSIGVNMYAMLAGKLPFKVENRSKNLAKLHACILKGFELPPFLSPDCQDLLCRLLDPAPNKRIKMSEILLHPWMNHNNSFPVEIIPYKPVVDIKEIKPHIVQYLVQKHDYAEADVIDAIVYRKPVALKAVYYLIEKRLKQGLSYPELDYNLTDTNMISNNNNNQHNLDNNSAKPSNNSNNSLFSNNTNNISSAKQVTTSINGTGVIKQNSQLLAKRHGAQIVPRSGSQKNVDFKSIFNNMNLNSANNNNNTPTATAAHINRYTSNVSRESDRNSIHTNNNNNLSNSPSPDFIAAAMTPAKNTLNHNLANSANSQRNSRQINNNLQETRKTASNASSYSTYNQNNNNTENKTDRYYLPNNDDNHQQTVMYYQQQQQQNGIKSGTSNNSNGIRSLPGSVYRGSPERSLPRSPERQMTNGGGDSTNNNYRPTSRISSSRPSVSELQNTTDKNYDAQKFRVANYLATKRSLTSCEESHPHDSKQRNSAVVKNRQLQMDLNVGVSIKNIGNYLKSTISRSSNNNNNPESLKSFNSLNIKTNSSNNTKTNSSTTNNNGVLTDSNSKVKNSANLQHRHSNPGGSTIHHHNQHTSSGLASAKSRAMQQQNSNPLSDNPANALPRIRINS